MTKQEKYFITGAALAIIILVVLYLLCPSCDINAPIINSQPTNIDQPLAAPVTLPLWLLLLLLL